MHRVNNLAGYDEGGDGGVTGAEKNGTMERYSWRKKKNTRELPRGVA